MFQDLEDIKDLNAVPKDTSSDSYVQPLEICKKCVTVKRDYSDVKQSRFFYCCISICSYSINSSTLLFGHALQQ
jgi:hypothetical protein